MKNTFYVLRAIDAHGDNWPLSNPLAGIDGIRHTSKASAEAAAEYARSEECILGFLDQSAEIYTEDGEEF